MGVNRNNPKIILAVFLIRFLFLSQMAKGALGTFEADFTETMRTNTKTAGVACPPGPTLIETFATILTRYKHRHKGF